MLPFLKAQENRRLFLFSQDAAASISSCGVLRRHMQIA